MSTQPMNPSPRRRSGTKRGWLLLPAVATLAFVASFLPAQADEDAKEGNFYSHFADDYANHYKCYDAKETDELEEREVTLEDQFGSGQAVALRAQILCNPVSKNDEEVPNPESHLVCFEIVQNLEPIERKVLVENQFGKRTLIVEQPTMLCLPSSKIEL